MANYSDLFKEYIKKFTIARSEQEGKGLLFFDPTQFTKKEFEAMFTGTKNHLESEGLNSSSSAVIDYMVESQRYSRSRAQAIEIQKAMERMDISVSLEEAQTWGGLEKEERRHLAPKAFQEFWDKVEARREELKSEGKKGKQLAILIAQEFFGS